MAPSVHMAMTWILFLALFPMAFFWLRRAWRILVKRDFSEVALKRGDPPPNPQRWAPFTLAINLIAGVVVACVILGIVMGVLAYDTWTAIAGGTIWCKFFADYALSRTAHPIVVKKPAQEKPSDATK